MNDKALRILEYHKIINLLIDKATSLPGKEVCKKLTPMTELAAIEEAQQQTADAFTRLIKGGRIHFSDNKDIRLAVTCLLLSFLKLHPLWHAPAEPNPTPGQSVMKRLPTV